MSDKMPKFKRPDLVIVGKTDPKTKEKYKNLILDFFGEGHYKLISQDKIEFLKSLEYDKKNYEKLAIQKSNEITNSLLKEFGLMPFDIPERNINILPDKLFNKILENINKIFQDKKLDAVTF